MKILMLVNWKVAYCKGTPPKDKQSPDFYVEGQPYWFFKYFENNVTVDVVDISSFPWMEHFEKEKLRFYVLQTLRVLPKLSKYDMILSHGMQSGIVVSLLRRIHKTRAKHIVFDIGSFNSAAREGSALKLMQTASKSIDGLIYHTGRQAEYYSEFFPWLEEKSTFIPFGTDVDFFRAKGVKQESMNIRRNEEEDSSLRESSVNTVILCVGYAKRDWDTLYHAFLLLCMDEDIQPEIRDGLRLKLIGREDAVYKHDKVEMTSCIPVCDLMNEIEKADFCVLPLKEYNYSFGQMTLLQQMSMRKAVIASRVSSMKDYVEDGVTALFYEPENAEDLKDKMKMLILDRTLRNCLADRAESAVRQQFNEPMMAKRIENLINRCMQNAQKGAKCESDICDCKHGGRRS